MADKFEKSFCEEGKRSKYFSTNSDSTPDVSHVDQLTFILQYVNTDGEKFDDFLILCPLNLIYLKDVIL